MAAALPSYTTDNATGVAPTFTKPTGLAVGDMMVAVIYTFATGAPREAYLKSGWTQLLTSGWPNNDWGVIAQYKIADASDVAASNFVFDISSSAPYAGFLGRITGFGLFDATSYIQVANDTTPVTLTGFTPDLANCFFLFSVVGRRGTISDPTFSDYAMVTDNPTWTEIFDSSVDLKSQALATATRSAVTATGDLTVAFSGGGTGPDFAAVVIAIAPALAATSTPDPVAANAHVPLLLSPALIDAVVPAPTTSAVNNTQWQNDTKPSVSDITNTNKP